MDKAREAKRRGANRLKLSHAPAREDVAVLSEKSRREKRKLKKLSSVVGKKSSSSYEDCEMDANGGGENERRNAGEAANCSIRFKLAGRPSREDLIKIDDCTHTPVPRRIRSAMKKRNCDSVSPRSPESKKKLKTSVNGGTALAKTEIVKKSKSNMKQRRSKSNKCSRGFASGPITKEEEEVAETLYALAGMVHNDDDDKGKRESSDVPESNNSQPLAVKDINESSVGHLEAAECAIPLSIPEILPDAVKDGSSKDTTSSLSKKPQLSPDKTIPPINHQTSPSLSEKSETKCELNPTFSSFKSSIPSELYLDNGSKQSQQNEVPFHDRKPGTGLGTMTLIGNQMGLSSKVEEFKKTGLELWPGLPSTSASRDLQVHESSSLPSISKLPAGLNVAYSNSRNSSAQYNSFGKVGTAPTDKRRIKRCATHVHISRLIHGLVKEKTKGSYEELNQGVPPAINNFHGLLNGANKGVVSTGRVELSVAKLSHNAAKDILHQDNPQRSVPSAVSNWKTQNYDFFTSVARGIGMEVSNSSRVQNVSEAPSPLQNHYVPTFVQNQFGTPFSGAQPSFNSSVSAYSDQLSSAQQVQMQLPSSYVTLYGAQVTKHHHQEQQKRQLWGSHYRADDSPKTTIQFLGGASSQKPQHQPLAEAPAQFSTGKMIRQERPLGLVYGSEHGGYRSSALPLQLLCNEHLS